MHMGGVHPIKVFLIDSHRILLWGLERLIDTVSPCMTVVGRAMTPSDEMFAELNEVTPDVVLVGLEPTTKGLLEQLQSARTPAPAVLVLTGSSESTVHEQAIVDGARGVVNKAEQGDVILRAIEKVHSGEIWITRRSIGRLMHTISTTGKADPEATKIAALTCREREIVLMVIRENCGRNRVIAEKLHMSDHTLRNNLTRIYSKLQVAGRFELYLYALKYFPQPSLGAPSRPRAQRVS